MRNKFYSFGEKLRALAREIRDNDFNSEDDPEPNSEKNLCSVCGDPVDKHFHVDPETGLEIRGRCYKRCKCGNKNCNGGSGAV